jgi:hypothetical protein
MAKKKHTLNIGDGTDVGKSFDKIDDVWSRNWTVISLAAIEKNNKVMFWIKKKENNFMV